MSTTGVQRIQPAGPWLLLVVLSSALTLAAIFLPWFTVGVLILLLFIPMTARAVSGLRFWQQLTWIGLLGYIALGYGFANLTLPRIPVPVGHVMMAAALVLALPGRGADVRRFLQEPLVWCWLGLAGLTLLHLIDEIPTYGAFAIRDSSVIAEGVFLLSGFLWARQRLGFHAMLRTLLLILLVNLLYSLTFPVSDRLAAISPRSGIFLDVPLLGTYTHNPLFLVSGALFVLLLGERVFRWPPLIVSVLAVLQLLWSLVFQSRAMYVGMIAAAVILAITGERRRAAHALGGIAMSILLVGMLGALGVQFEGRVGSFSPEFFQQHLRSFLLSGDTPGVGTTQWRVDLAPQILERWTASAATLVVGEGFGQPLIEWHTVGDVAVRQPHNTHVTVLMRLGLVGLLLWAMMHARIAYLLVRGVQTARRSTAAHGFAVWMLAFYVLGMLFTTVQPWLEFSSGAIPFYILIGFTAGLVYPGSGATNPAQEPPC